MQATGYGAKRRLDPVGLGVVIALHAGVLGAVLLIAPDIIPKHVFTDIQLIPLPEPKVPPRIPPQPRTKPVERRIDLTQQIVTPPTHDDPILPLPLPPQPPQTSGNGTVVPTIPPPPAPVIVEARLDPRYAGDLQPAYPAQMERAEITGQAVVRVLVGTDGRVKQVTLVSADDPAFYEATERQALRHWRFTPATRDGIAVESWRQMTVHFRMNG